MSIDEISSHVALCETDPMLPCWHRVRHRQWETHDTVTLELEAPGESPEFRFAPGQFNMLYVFGVGEVPISISGDPSDARRIVHTVRAVGGVTRAMAQLKRGDPVGVRGPFGVPWPVEAATTSTSSARRA